MNEKKLYINVKDYSVTGEEFQLLYNEKMDMLETFPQPSEDKLPQYYNSEDYISHTASKRNLFERIYHVVKSFSLKRKLKIINSFSTKGKTLLDVGCGTGDFLKYVQQNNWKVSGIEPNKKAREAANFKVNNSVYDSDQLLNFQANSFDVITLWHVLEHLPELNKHMLIFKNLLKQNGVLIIAVPNYKSYDAFYYRNFWAAFDVPRHLWHFSKNSISKLVESNHMKVVKTLPLIFDAFYVSLLSEKHKSGTLNPLKAFWIGCASNLKATRSEEYSSLIYIIKNQTN